MNRNDVNRLFTDQVAGLLAKGYQIHTGTMGGSQGEIAHVDLSNGSEILRVLLESGSDFRAVCSDYITIKVGKCTDRLNGRWDDTIWNNRLEIRFEIKLAKISDNCFVTPDEAQPMIKKRHERWRRNGSRYDFTTERRELGDAYKSVALRWLRRQPKLKTCKLEDITKLERVVYSDGTSGYQINAKGHTHLLSANRR